MVDPDPYFVIKELGILGERMTSIRQAVDESKTAVQVRIEDHETRLRSVEKWVWALPTSATILALTALVVTLVTR